MKRISGRDLAIMLERAKDQLVELPVHARLVGMTRDLTEAERLAVCYLVGALVVVSVNGIDTVDIVIEFDDSMVEPT